VWHLSLTVPLAGQAPVYAIADTKVEVFPKNTTIE
jgi:hypothetical protein